MEDNYTYYKKVISNEHMMYASEICNHYNLYEILPMTSEIAEKRGVPYKDTLEAVMYHIPNKRANENKVHKMIRDYVKSHNINLEPLYYSTRNGLKRVYPVSLVEAVMEEYNIAIKEEVTL